MKKIKVLHVLDILAVAGIQQQILTLLSSIDRSKIDAIVCTLFSRDKKIPEPLAYEIRKLGIKVYPLAMESWRDFSTIKKFRNIIKKENIDIVHGHSAQVDFWACFLAKILFNKKTVYTKHDIRKLKDFKSTIPKLQYWLLNKFFSDKIITVSNSIRNQLIADYNIKESKITTIYNPVDLNIFNKKKSNSIRAEIDVSASTPLIGCVSRLVPRKGFNIFLKTAALVLKEKPDVHFVIVGHGTEEKKLRLLAKELKIEKNVHWLIHRRDVPNILNTLDIFFFTPLWREGFGIVFIEAMACGLPIVATNVGPVPEIIQDGQSGYLPYPKKWILEIEDAPAEPFARKLCFLLDNPEKAKELGNNGLKFIKNNFAVTIVAKQYVNFYKEML